MKSNIGPAACPPPPLRKISRALKLAVIAFIMASGLGLTGCDYVEFTSCFSSSNDSGGSRVDSGEAENTLLKWSVEVTSPVHNQEVVVEEGDSVTLVVEVTKDSDPYMADWYCNGGMLDYAMKSIDGENNLTYTIHNISKEMDGWEYWLRFTPDSEINVDKDKAHFVTSPMFTLKVVFPGQAPQYYGGGSYDNTIGHDDTFMRISRASSIKGWEGEDGADGADAAFGEGDRIRVWAWTGNPDEVPGQCVDNGAVNTFVKNNWKSTPTNMLWADMTSEHYFLGIQNQTNGTGIIDDFTADPYALPMNEDGTVDNEKADVLVATELSGLKATDTPVELTFEHIMAKLLVNLDLDGDYGETLPVVTLANTYTEATVDYLAGEVAGEEESRGEITLGYEGSDPEGNVLTYSSIAIPDHEGELVLRVTMGNQEYVYAKINEDDIPEGNPDIPLESGKVTTVNLDWSNLYLVEPVDEGEDPTPLYAEASAEPADEEPVASPEASHAAEPASAEGSSEAPEVEQG